MSDQLVPSDQELMERVAGGDRAALGSLYDRYAPILVALGERMLRVRREAEDLAHDVFLEAWRQAADYDPQRGSVRAWLTMRTRSRALDRLRSGWARAVHTAEPIEIAVDPAPDHESRSDHGTLRRALGALPLQQREVLELGYFEGLSSSEIAERLEIPLGTVKSRVAGALARLRAELAATGP